MRTRAEIKQEARAALAARRGTSIGLVLSPYLITVALYAVFYLIERPGGSFFTDFPFSFSTDAQIGWVMTAAAPMGVAAYVIMLIAAVAELILSVTLCGGFTQIYRGDSISAGSVLSRFPQRWLRKLGAMLLVTLLSTLWTLLFYVPVFVIQFVALGAVSIRSIEVLAVLSVPLMIVLVGAVIVKLMSYALVPYIVAEYPSVTAREAVRLSVRMTKGHRRQLVVMQLSFIGWIFLSALTLMILGIAHVIPYMEITMAGYYAELRDLALMTNIVSPDELGDSDYVTAES